MTPRFDLGAPVDTATDRSLPGPIGTWTIDHAHSGVALTWRRLRLGTVTGRLHCLGIIHLDDLPPVGVVRFQQPSGLPVLTMALDPASVETGDARLDTRLCGPDAFDVTRHAGGPCAARAWSSCPPASGGSRQPSPPAAPQTWSSCAPRPRPATTTRWSCEAGECWTDGRWASASHPGPAALGSGSTWSCTPDEWSPTAAPNSRGCRSLRGGG